MSPSFTFPIITISGLIDSINPCAISVLFISLSFLIGLNYHQKKIIQLGLLYILGVYLAYFLIGIGILKTLGSIGIPTILILKVFALLLIIFGFNQLLKILRPEKSMKLQIPNFIKPTLARLTQKASGPTSFLLGALVGVFEFPCTGGPYLFVLSLLHAKTTFWIGLVYLFYYNLLFVFPLILILYLSYKFQDLKKIQEKSKALQKHGKLLSPVILILLGILILFFYK
jgi:cytochrome c biogenesis protein CcdA